MPFEGMCRMILYELQVKEEGNPMRFLCRLQLILSVLFLLLLGPVAAQELTDVNEIIRRHAATYGGEGRQFSSAEIEQEMSVMGFKTNMRMTLVGDSISRVEMTVLGVTTIAAMCGDRGWTYVSKRNPPIEELDLEKIKQMKSDSTLFSPLYTYYIRGKESGFTSVVLEGSERVNRQRCYKIRLTDTAGNLSRCYIDHKDFLMLRMEDKSNTFNFSDYRVVDGVTYPHHVTVGSGLTKVTMKLKSARFDIPVDVEQLLKKPTVPTPKE